QSNSLNESRCKSEIRANELAFEGVVTKKFLDSSSHMWETVKYLTYDKKEQSTLLFMNDQSGAFDFIIVGDSIFKRKNSLEFTIRRASNLKTYKLNYGCNAN
ncbi:MAG: hypothetical protein MUE72_09315, partial [Chitinophagaceae bacterium]|nr:hypothetical protein [Chitinophagaceae bacterium]